MRSSDNYLVNVLDKLEETGLYDDTLTSQRRPRRDGPDPRGMRQKNFNVYEEATRIPLVYSNPKLFPKPLQTDALVSHVDFLPTLASLARPEKRPGQVQGVDYSSLILRPSPTSRLRIRRLHLRRLPVRPSHARIRNRRTTSSASAKGAGRSPSTTTSNTRNGRSGSCTTSGNPLEKPTSPSRLRTVRHRGEAVPAA